MTRNGLEDPGLYHDDERHLDPHLTLTPSNLAAMSKPAPKQTHPLPLSSTLHDLALLRASDLDFAALLTDTSTPSNVNASTHASTAAPEVEASVQRSLQFSREARAALKLAHGDAVEREGSKLEDARARLDDAVRGLDAESA